MHSSCFIAFGENNKTQKKYVHFAASFILHVGSNLQPVCLLGIYIYNCLWRNFFLLNHVNNFYMEKKWSMCRSQVDLP
jgi:hypothetical protein